MGRGSPPGASESKNSLIRGAGRGGRDEGGKRREEE